MSLGLGDGNSVVCKLEAALYSRNASQFGQRVGELPPNRPGEGISHGRRRLCEALYEVDSGYAWGLVMKVWVSLSKKHLVFQVSWPLIESIRCFELGICRQALTLECWTRRRISVHQTSEYDSV